MDTQVVEKSTEDGYGLGAEIAAMTAPKAIEQVVEPVKEVVQEPVKVVEPEAKTEPKVEEPVKEVVAPVTETKNWQQDWEAPAAQKNPEQEQEEKVLAKYKDDFDVANFTKNDPIAKAIYENRNNPNFDLNAWVHASNTDYSKANEETILRAFAEKTGLQVSEEDITAELEALAGKSIFEKKAWRDNLISQLPKPINVADKIKEYHAQNEQQSKAAQDKYNGFVSQVNDFAASKVGTMLDGEAISQQEIDTAKRVVLDGTFYLKDPNDPYSYDFSKAIRHIVFAQRYENNLGKIKEVARTEAKVEAALERANASTETTVHNTDVKGYTDEQLHEIRLAKIIYQGNPERMKDELKLKGINI